ncbi:hypothetical protein K435DRAFT_867578 [Dendrothele bispora CBS 962.96]|uniref:Uncharacterized protein n=1 Tax=Dendrothele bispora (strain CBS 962.96) TaxID=1314807 RepID=A0A4S8LDZ1_DENBC|nr:hypothetical protein K435DRAFT_867578 [Dendrothele bispora CBS 962.96]
MHKNTNDQDQNRQQGSPTNNSPGTGLGGGGPYPPPPTTPATNAPSSQDVTMDAGTTQHGWGLDAWTGAITHARGCPTCDAYRQHLMRNAQRGEPSLEVARREREAHFTATGSANLLRDLADRNREVAELEREVSRLRQEREDARGWMREYERRLDDRDRDSTSRQRGRVDRDDRRNQSPRRPRGRNTTPPPRRNITPQRPRETAPQGPARPATTPTDPPPQRHPIEKALESDDEEEDSEEERRKKRRKLPKPPKLPNPSAGRKRPAPTAMANEAVVPNEQRLNMRVPTRQQLAGVGRPSTSSGPFTFEGVQTVNEAQDLLAAANISGNWGALHQIQRTVAVVAIMNHDHRQIPPGASYLAQHWRRPQWLQDAAALRRTYEQDDSADFVFNGDLLAVPQPQPSDHLSVQAPWFVLHSNPWSHTGVPVSTEFQVDLATLLGNNLYRLLHPRSNRPARQRFMYMFVELASQPFLYEQLLRHWNVQVAQRESLYPFSAPEVMAAGGRFSMETLVRELARRGITAARMNSINDWGIQFIADATTVFPIASDFWRQLQWTASHRLRDYGRPPMQDLGINRNWNPPEEWNLAERGTSMMRERLHRISLQGQTNRGTRQFHQRAGEARLLARTEKFALQNDSTAPSANTTVQEQPSTSSTSTNQPPAPVPSCFTMGQEREPTETPLAPPPSALVPHTSTVEPPPNTNTLEGDVEMAEPTVGDVTSDQTGLDDATTSHMETEE